MASVKDLLLSSLKDLGKDDLKEFQWHLVNDNERISRYKMEDADWLKAVEMLVACFTPEEEAVKITVDILRKMKQNHLAERLENEHKQAQMSSGGHAGVSAVLNAQTGGTVIAPVLTGNTSTGPVTIISTTAGHEPRKISDTAEKHTEKQASQRQCQTCAGVWDSAECDLIEPSVILEDAQMKYRLNLRSGCYECSRTGLRIECSHDVQLKYHICDWKCVGDFPEMEHFTPCGPLMDIVVISGELKAVYLPHFLCLGGPHIRDKVKVLHVEDCGISFEKCTLTRFHGKLLNHSFSPKGLLLRTGFSVNYHCETFIYETQKTYLTLHVYLIPSEKKMIEAVENNEIKSKTRLISKPGPVSSLQTKTWYSLRTLDENKESECHSEVQPKQLELKYKPIKPDFFEVFIATPKDFHLQLMPQHHNESVWDAKIRQADYSHRVSSVAAETAQEQEGCKNDNGAGFVDKHRTELIRGVSLVEPIADDMKPLIGDEKYQTILNSGTRQAQMRALLDFLTTATLKEKLYQSLVERERSVVEDLEHHG